MGRRWPVPQGLEPPELELPGRVPQVRQMDHRMGLRARVLQARVLRASPPRRKCR